MQRESQRQAYYYYGWNIVFAVIVMQIFVMGILLYGTGLAMLAWEKEFSTSRVLLTSVPVGMQLAIAVMSPVGGQILDRFPVRRVLFAGLTVFIAALLLISAATAFWQILALHVTLVAASHVLIGAMTAQTLTGKWFARRRGLALSLAAVGGGAGGLLVPPTFQHLIDSIGWRSAYLVLAAISVTIVTPLVFAVRPPPSPLPAVENKEAAKEPAISRISTMRLITDPVFLATSFGLAALISVQLVFQYNLPAIGRDSGVSSSQAAFLLSVLAGTSILSKPAWGPLLDRAPAGLAFTCMAVLYCTAIVVTVLAPSHLAYASLVLAAALAGFSAGGVQALLGVVLARRFGAANFGKALGLAFPVLTLSAVGPLVAAASFSQTASYDLGFVVLGTMVVIASLVLVRTLRANAPAVIAP